jgi:hypothetical protein
MHQGGIKESHNQKISTTLRQCVCSLFCLLHGVFMPLVKHCSHVIFKLKVKHIDFETFCMLFNNSVGVGII